MSVLRSVSPLWRFLERSEVETLKSRWRVLMRVVVLTRSRVDEYLICLCDFLPVGWSIRIVWQVLRTVLECKSLVCPVLRQYASGYGNRFRDLLVQHRLDVPVQSLWIDVHDLIQEWPVALVDLGLIGVLRVCLAGGN